MVFLNCRKGYDAHMNMKFPPTRLRESIYATVCFFDVFDKPVHRRDFFRYLFGVEGYQEDVDEFLAKEKRLGRRGDYYFLPGREETVAVKDSRGPVNDLYWKKVMRYVPKLHKVPFIQAVAVCNSLAFENCTSESDIDLFIITKKGRIFIARVLSGILLHLLGVRRHKEKVAGRLCLSFYVAEDGMDLSGLVKEDEVYLYYWMRSLEFVYRRDDKIYGRFYKKNKWFLKEVPGGMGAMHGNKRSFFSRIVSGLFEFVLGGKLGDFVESRLEKRHLKRFDKRKKELGAKSDVVVSKKMLKFHNIDRRNDFNQAFFERYRRILWLFLSGAALFARFFFEVESNSCSSEAIFVAQFVF